MDIVSLHRIALNYNVVCLYVFCFVENVCGVQVFLIWGCNVLFTIFFAAVDI